MRALLLLLPLAACVGYPDVGIEPESGGAAYPPLLPLEAVLGPETPPRLEPGEAERLEARGERLRARAEALRAR